ILTSRLRNSPSIPAIAPSSVVQTGVKFFGCEKRTAQPSPIQSWKLIGPAVVSAVKSGAISLIRRLMVSSLSRCGRCLGCAASRRAVLGTRDLGALVEGAVAAAGRLGSTSFKAVIDPKTGLAYSVRPGEGHGGSAGFARFCGLLPRHLAEPSCCAK